MQITNIKESFPIENKVLKIKENNSAFSESDDANYSTLLEKYEADKKAWDNEGKGVRL